ncbi:hypothetical protein M23134_03556 [Microscilla marina ATCC 23134]|uniref:Uncharacterized protein n=1 Tax=Microscilla marina ATCC 23134 TaxID=313606 RepID=A1ZRK0_MICM2|nr:hypothetical protein M23134_03556 [Microscilla marina ATCC 23134]
MAFKSIVEAKRHTWPGTTQKIKTKNQIVLSMTTCSSCFLG